MSMLQLPCADGWCRAPLQAPHRDELMAPRIKRYSFAYLAPISPTPRHLDVGGLIRHRRIRKSWSRSVFLTTKTRSGGPTPGHPNRGVRLRRKSLQRSNQSSGPVQMVLFDYALGRRARRRCGIVKGTTLFWALGKLKQSRTTLHNCTACASNSGRNGAWDHDRWIRRDRLTPGVPQKSGRRLK